MIVIDIDMPNNCRECPLRTKGNMSPFDYCMALLGRKLTNDIYNSKADFCPIKCDIEDIKAEILGLMSHDDYMVDGFNVLEIIDNHIKGDTDADSD